MELNLKNEMNYLQQFPYRSAIALVDTIKDIIKDKFVIDIGCGCGDILEYMRHNNITQNVLGYELHEQFVKSAHANGRLYIRNENVTLIDIPVADVYYLWTSPDLLTIMIDKLPQNAIVITSNNSPHIDYIHLNPKLEFIESRTYTYDETYSIGRRLGWDYVGSRDVHIYKIKP